MQSERKKIDDLFGQGLQEFQETPPMYAWDRLEDELRAGRRKKRMIIIRSAAAVGLVLLAFSVGYFFPTKMPQENQMAASQNPVKSEQPNNLIDPNTKNIYQPDNSSDVTQQHVTTNMNAFADASEISDEKSISDQIPAISLTSEQSSGTHPVDFIKKLITLDFEGLETELVAPDNFYNPIHKYPVKQEYLAHFVVNEVYDEDFDKESRSWEIGGEFSPIYSYKQSGGEVNDKLLYIAENTSLDKVTEQPIMTMSMGVNASFDLSDRLSVQSGLYYSQLGHSNQDVIIEKDYDNGPQYAINTPAGEIQLNGMPLGIYQNRNDATVQEVEFVKHNVDFNLEGQADVNITQHFDYIEIPVLVRYRLNEGKFNLRLIGGVSTAVLVKNYSLMKHNSKDYLINETQNINSMLYNGIAGVGMVYNISDKLTFNMEPTFRYAIRSISSQSDVVYRPYSLGWFTGIRYKF